LLRTERRYWGEGLTRICGVDEVGVGPLAGPLVAAAVVLPPEIDIRGVDDSKKLSAQRRQKLSIEIRAAATAFAVGIVEVEEVDRLNTYWAALEAMRRAVAGLAVTPERLLIDARKIPDLAIPQESIVKGDARSYSIAAASIIAKEVRDQIMRELDAHYPEYGFARHMGYGTRVHLEALERYGPCAAHRRSFEPVRQARLPGS
jgi:ribonuclease HII